MASYAGTLGKLNVDQALKDINNASSIGAARSVVKQIMNDATKLGVTDNDQAAVANVLSQFAIKYNLSNDKEMVKLINSWDPSTKEFKSANAFNSGTRVNNDYDTLQNIISSYNYNASGATTKKTEADIIKENTNSKTGKVSLPGYENTNTESSSSSSSGGTVKSTGGSPGVNTDYYERLIAAQGKDLKKLEDTIASLEEQLKPRSAQENAERYGIDYDEQHILDDYNTKTNEYFQNAIDEQEALRYQYAFNNARAAQQTLNDYVDSYMNAAPTATKRGTIAANALGQYINSNYTNNLNDYGMVQSINQLGKDWDAELANNPTLARQYYNNIGTYLSSLGANQHASDVKQYIDTLDAYSQAYAASRAASAYVAQGTANKYAGLANAAVANAQSNADKYNSFMQYYNWNLNAYGNNGKQASTGITNNLQNSAGYSKNT